MKAISYLRFSTPEQKLGNSTERQLKGARDYCARNGLELDESLSIADEGFSAYKNEHVDKGSFGHFLAEVRAGKIPSGTALIIENLDRLSRQGIDATTDLLKQLTRYGIDVHVIAINRVLKAGFNNSLVDYMLIGVQADLANQESVKKSERVGSAWISKKQRMAAGDKKLYTSRMPLWLAVEDGKIVTVPLIVERARKAFKMAANGIGVDHITAKLSRDGVPSRTWFARLLSDRAVLGEFKPKGCESVPGYFPQIISQSDFDEVRQTMSSKRRGGRYVGGNKRNSMKADHLLSGLVFDLPPAGDERPSRIMHFQSVGRFRYLLSAFDPKRKSNRINYSQVEGAVLRFLEKEDWQSIAGSSESEECKAAKSELQVLLREIDATERRIQNKTSAMDGDCDVATLRILAAQLAKDETLLATLGERRELLQVNVDTACSKCAALYEPEVLLDLIHKNTPEANDIRLRLRAELRKRIKRIDLCFAPDGAFAIDGVILMTVEYVNGVVHQAGFRRGDSRIFLMPDVQQGEDISERVRG
jgi:DNA invertase Pin-like site-specific DNA recombinase